MMPPIPSSWHRTLRNEIDAPYFRTLERTLDAEIARFTIYPHADEIFQAFEATPYRHVKVLILGQDPYHGPGQAHGLCFSVEKGVPPPPSLVNILKELHTDLDCPIPDHGCLDSWARNGVLLLNAVLTVRSRAAASHAGKGWEIFTDEVIRTVSAKPDHVVFILWGGHARTKKTLIDRNRHTIMESPHPSPLSAHQGFLGSRPFSRTNGALEAHGQPPIDWRL